MSMLSKIIYKIRSAFGKGRLYGYRVKYYGPNEDGKEMLMYSPCKTIESFAKAGRKVLGKYYDFTIEDGVLVGREKAV